MATLAEPAKLLVQDSKSADNQNRGRRTHPEYDRLTAVIVFFDADNSNTYFLA